MDPRIANFGCDLDTPPKPADFSDRLTRHIAREKPRIAFRDQEMALAHNGSNLVRDRYAVDLTLLGGGCGLRPDAELEVELLKPRLTHLANTRTGQEADPDYTRVPTPAGTIHLPDWADSEWLKQLVAEQLVTIRDRRGYARQEWQKMRERNEALDTRVYARAAAWILGADRFDERMWRQLERQAGVETLAVAEIAETEKAAEPQAGQITATRRRGWKISTPRYME